MTPDETLRESMKVHATHPAWLAVVEYAHARRAQLDENLRFRGCTERDADFYRGQASALGDFLSLHTKLTQPEPDHGD